MSKGGDASEGNGMTYLYLACAVRSQDTEVVREVREGVGG